MAYLSPQLPGMVLDRIVADHDRSPFLADQITPGIMGARKGTIPVRKIGADFGLAGQDLIRLPGQDIPTLLSPDYTVVDYTAQQFAGHILVPVEEIREAGAAGSDLLADAGDSALDQVMLKVDRSIVSLLEDSAWSYDVPLVGAARWVNRDSALPHVDLQAAIRSVRTYAPSARLVPVFGEDMWDYYISNDSVLAAMPNDADRALADDDWYLRAVGRKLGTAKPVIVRNMYNTSANPDSPSLSKLFQGKVWIGAVADSGVAFGGRIKTKGPSAFVRVISERGHLEQYYDKDKRSEDMQAFVEEAHVVTSLRLGALITTGGDS